MKKGSLLYVVTLIVAFCSIVYELILGQTLSALLGNTILRYSITIGLYLFAMGFGAIIAEGRLIRKAELMFAKVELALTIWGGFVIFFLFFFHVFLGSGMLFVLVAHSIIILIGVLTGFEIPLLIEMQNKLANGKESRIIGIDYAGAFLGSIVFAFVFYPKMGLVPSAAVAGILNAVAGLMAYGIASKRTIQKEKVFRIIFFAQVFILAVLVVVLAQSAQLNEFLVLKYLNS